MDRAAQIQGYDKVNPKLRLEQLLKKVQVHGYNVPNMEGYEQFGTKFGTELLRDAITFTRQKNAKDFRLFALNDYKKSYANTRKYNTKTKKYQLFDTRTGTFFDRDNAFEYINSKYGKGLFQGVMSNEVPKEAVVKMKNGYDAVNYSMLDVEFKQI